jgi:hypothetical protein
MEDVDIRNGDSRISPADLTPLPKDASFEEDVSEFLLSVFTRYGEAVTK